MEKEIKLTEDEIKTLQEYQKAIDGEKSALGNLRLQFLLSEKNIVNKIERSQNDFYAHLKMLSQGKGIPSDGTWVFDPINCVFYEK